MSFSRAKLQRFNENKSDAPSPTRYAPKCDSSAKGGVIPKGERERTTSETMSTGSSTPFRTPFAVVKKHSCHTTEKSGVVRGIFPDITVSSAENEELNMLREECMAKAQDIADLERIVDNLTAQVASNEKEKENLVAKAAELEATINSLKSSATINENLEKQIDDLTKTVNDLKAQIKILEEEKADLVTKKNDAEARIVRLEEGNLEYERRIISLEGTLEQVTLEYKDKEKEATDLQEISNKLKISIECLHGKISMLEDAKSKNEETIFGLETEVSSLNHALEELKNEEMNINCLKELISVKETQIQALLKNNADNILQHKEELFRLENEWNSKVLEEIQAKEEAVLEKEAVIKLADMQCTKKIEEIKEKWEKKLQEAEEQANTRLSEQIEKNESVKDKFEAQVTSLEASIARHLQEIVRHEERYKEVVEELNQLVEDIQEKNQSIVELKEANGEYSQLLEQLKAECSEKEKKLNEMTLKYQEEWKKNEKLSEQLGEIDTKVKDIDEELKQKNLEKSLIAADLKKTRDENNALKIKNLDLQLTTVKHQERADRFVVELDESRQKFKEECMELVKELTDVKSQCRKFEIAMSDTRKSLDALCKRLMESESEVERLTNDNESLKAQFLTSEEIKSEIEKKCRSLHETKIDLEQRLQAAEVAESNLRDKCKELELRNCDLELSANELLILKETLEQDKANYETSLDKLRDMLKEQNLKMIEMERASLDQIDAVSQTFITKIEDFQKISLEKLVNLNTKIKSLTERNKDLQNKFEQKSEEYENLFTDHEILKTASEIARKEADSLKRHYEEQNIELDNCVNKINDVARQRDELKEKLKSTINNHEYEVRELITINKQLKEDILQLEVKVNEKDSIIKEAYYKKEELKVTYESKLKELLLKMEDDIEQVRKEKKEYQTQLMQNSEEVTILLVELENGRQEKYEMEDLIKSQQQTINELQETNTKVKLELEQVRCEKKTTEEKVEQLTQEAINNKKEMDVKIRMLESEKSKLLADYKAKCEVDWRAKWETLLSEKEELAKKLDVTIERKEFYKSHCQRLEKCAVNEATDREAAEKDFNHMYELLQKSDEENAKLKKRIGDLESLIKPFREQLEQFEAERKLLENDMDNLRKQHLEQAAKLGHQNLKQKIHYLVNLKSDFLDLKKENEKLKIDLKAKGKAIEQLRERLGEHPKRLFIGGKRPESTPFKGKENSLQLKQEPMSPLRERNQ